MKKHLLFAAVLGLTIASCSSEQPESTAPTEATKAAVEAMENSIEKVDEALEESEQEMKKNQDEIDDLLNDI